MRKTILFLIGFQLFNHIASATVYMTICDGNFSQNIWAPSNPPASLSPLDTIIINNDVTLDINYNLSTGGVMIIQSGASLSTTSKSLVSSGILQVYGDLEVYNLTNNLLMDNYGTVKVFNNLYDNPLFNGGAANIIQGDGSFQVGGYVYTNISSVILGSVDFCKMDAGGGDPFYAHWELLGPDVTICDPALAIKLISFTAITDQESSNILISWTISDQQDLAVYNLEKSDDGKVFYPLYSVSADYSSGPVTSAYSFPDKVQRGKYYYRLSIHSEGKTLISSVIYEEVKFAGLQIYPNPLKTDEDLIISSLTDSSSLYIFNAAGEQVLVLSSFTGSSFKVPQSITRNPGVYYLKVLSEGEIFTEKLVIK